MSLPKGGGAIRGIGEKFSTNPATGTGSLSVPIATSPGRAGFELGLELAYDSGAGNGSFGIGWHLSTPSITRKTDKGLPRYADAEDSDVFVLSGAEDLVPVRLKDGSGTRPDAFDRGDYRVQRYRPRTEGLFARIERWTNRTTGDAHWRAITRDNVLNVYGCSPAARIADPERPERVFSWLLEETRDDRGNIARYTYKAEDSSGIDPGKASESNRFDPGSNGSPAFLATAQRYLKRIEYGNRVPVMDRDAPAPATDDPQSPVSSANWLFEVVFDYGEHDDLKPTPVEMAPWSLRKDPFSSYRATFEVRTYRLCRRVLMFHRFAELGTTPCLVRSTDFAYDEGLVVTYLTSVTQAGYKRDPATGTYERATVPPLDFGYVRPVVHDELRTIDRESLEGIASGVEGSGAQWVDLDGEGIPGVLIPTDRAWFYKANLGDGQLAPPMLERTLPAPAELRGGAQQLSDLGGDGNLDLVRYSAPLAGYFERIPERDWLPFVALPNLPNIDWNDPNLRFLDIDGDGFPDVLITEHDAFVWYRSRAKEGFEPAAFVTKPKDELKGPAVVFADGTETIQLADMSGDGLVDIVRVRSGEVCYWPNLGYGRFGRKVTLDNSPRFDTPDQFDPKRIRFADIDGSGTSDVVYLGRDGVRLYFSESGNALSAPRLLESLPPTDSLSSLSVVDLLGQGTACLVWSSPLPGNASRPLVFVDLMGSKKPHVLDSVKNNFGAETRIAYASSTKFYLKDKADGKPWLTRLSFPVQVIERIERYDHVAKSKLVTRFAYHHGFFDGYEREFRGFACVEQWDAESFAGEKGQGLFPELPYDIDPADSDLNLPPARTVTWFHTGAWLERERLEIALANEYYDKDPQAPLLPDTTLPSGLSVREELEAARALRGQILRQEIYAEDGTPEAAHPYTVSERDYEVRLLQPAEDKAHAVFFVHPRDTINLHYERKPNDPRLQQELVLDVDDFGNVTRSAAIGYPRRVPTEPEQRRLWVTTTVRTFANKPSEYGWYRVGAPVETITAELRIPVQPPGVLGVAQLGPLASAVAVDCARMGRAPTGPEDAILQEAQDAALKILKRAPSQKPAFLEVDYAVQDGDSEQIRWRVVERQRQLYYREYATEAEYWADASGPLPLGEITQRALRHQTFREAFTRGLVSQVYGARIADAVLRDEGRYIDQDGLWWAPSGRTVPDPTKFFLPAGALDSFGERHLVRHDNYALLLLDAQDPLENRVTSGLRDVAGAITKNGNDYRVLAPGLLCDPNRNRTEVEFDALGMVVKLWQKGREGTSDGDDAANPGVIFRYDLSAWRDGRGPAFAHAATREVHRAGGQPFAADGSARREGFQHARSYSDGSGREVMKKVQAEAGDVPIRKPGGGLDRNPDGPPRTRQEPSRWVGTGRTVFDNKGNPVKKYEPFFSDTLAYDDEKELVEWGVTPVMRYDPLGRLVRTDQPNGAFAKVVFDAWKQETWDENDTVFESAWYARWRQPPEDATQLLSFARSFAPSWTASPTYLECAGELCRALNLEPPSAPDLSWLASASGATPAIWKDVLSRAKEFKRAASLTARHAETPSIAHLDSLGRVFLTIADNGKDSIGGDRKYSTRAELDVEGNQLSVTDARSIRTLAQVFDVLGRRAHIISPDSGESRTLLDVGDKPIRTWNPRGYAARRRHDALQRPTLIFAQLNAGTEKVVECVVYGEGHTDAEDRNLRTRVYLSYDPAGGTTNARFDFKGNLVESVRRLAREYHDSPDWTPLAAVTSPGAAEAAANALLESETFPTTATFDALNRLVSRTTPDTSETRPTYNEAGLLEAIEVRIRGALASTTFVESVEYNARGQRELIRHGNNTSTRHEYDPLTFRLLRQVTTRAAGAALQDVAHTHDPVGNVVAIRDAVSFGNPNVQADSLYEYDPLYQLVKAEGREHPGQQPSHEDGPQLGLPPEAHPNDWQALRRYRESFDYDPVGNILEMSHQPVGSGAGGWTRRYRYATDSNRLIGTSAAGDPVGTFSATCDYDAAGNMTRMPHLREMEWDYANRLRHVKKQVQSGPGAANDVYFTYDSSGQRVRKVYEHSGRVEERIYLDGYEIYRKRSSSAAQPQFERQTLHVMDDRRRVALIETKTVDTSVAALVVSSRQRYQLENHIGSSVMEIDDTARVISYEEYLPFGSSAFRAGDSVIDINPRRYRYTGKERDEETGFYYHGARYYAAWLGRWTSADPRGLADGVNRYAYVRNRPVYLHDPSGRISENPSAKKPDVPALVEADLRNEMKVELQRRFRDQEILDLNDPTKPSPANGGDSLFGVLNRDGTQLESLHLGDAKGPRDAEQAPKAIKSLGKSAFGQFEALEAGRTKTLEKQIDAAAAANPRVAEFVSEAKAKLRSGVHKHRGTQAGHSKVSPRAAAGGTVYVLDAQLPDGQSLGERLQQNKANAMSATALKSTRLAAATKSLGKVLGVVGVVTLTLTAASKAEAAVGAAQTGDYVGAVDALTDAHPTLADVKEAGRAIAAGEYGKAAYIAASNAPILGTAIGLYELGKLGYDILRDR